jgi:hypothetical protein
MNPTATTKRESIMDTKPIQMSWEPTTYSLAEQLNQEMQSAGLIPQHWCNECAKQTWVITPEEAVEIAGISPGCYRANRGKAVMMKKIHTVTTSTGTALICLKSLFLCLFSVCEEAA